MMIEYKHKKRENKFTENGHIMFEEDVLQRLKRLADLEEQIKKGQLLPIDSVVGSYSLKVGDKIKMPSGLKAEVIKTKVKVKDDFGGEYYLSDIEVG
jgi:hypothetical protein